MVSLKQNLVLAFTVWVASFLLLSFGVLSQERVNIGDRVIPSSFSSGSGTVVAFNPEKEVYTIKGSNDGRNYHLKVSEFGLTSGGSSSVQVGDLVIPPGFSSGHATVVAFNPERGLFTVKSSSNGNYYRYEEKELGLTKGGSASIKVGDKVIPPGFSSGSATVVAYNPKNGIYTVRASNNGNYYRYEAKDLGLTSGGKDSIRVGDLVFPNGFSGGNATVVAFNTHNGQFTVRASNNGNYYRYEAKELGLISGGNASIKVGDKVIPPGFSSGYATVVSYNPSNGLFTMKGSNDGNYYRNEAKDLDLTSGGTDLIKVGDKVYPTAFSSGVATVVGHNPAKKTFTVRDSRNGRYYRYTADGLGVASSRALLAAAQKSPPKTVALPVYRPPTVPVPVPAPAPARKLVILQPKDDDISTTCKVEKRPSTLAKILRRFKRDKKSTRKHSKIAPIVAEDTAVRPLPSAPPLELEVPSAPPALDSVTASASEKADAHLCKVCFDKDVNCVITPCNHQGTCDVCALELKAAAKGCPFCRGPIVNVIKVFKQ